MSLRSKVIVFHSEFAVTCCLYIVHNMQVLLLAGNPGVSEAKFSTQVDLLSTTRTDLDIVWRGNCDQPPTAVDGGPPKPMGEPDWAIDPNSLESQSVRS